MSDKNPLAHICLKCNATAGNFCQEPDPKSPSGFTKLDSNKFHIERLIASGAHPYNAEKVMTPLDVQCPLCGRLHGESCIGTPMADPYKVGVIVSTHQAREQEAQRVATVLGVQYVSTPPPFAFTHTDHINVKTGETWSAKPSDPINPAHYRGDLVMRIIEHFGLQDDFALGNVIKYILRHKSKAGIEDLKKARWYLDRRIAQLDGSLKGSLS